MKKLIKLLSDSFRAYLLSMQGRNIQKYSWPKFNLLIKKSGKENILPDFSKPLDGIVVVFTICFRSPWSIYRLNTPNGAMNRQWRPHFFCLSSTYVRSELLCLQHLLADSSSVMEKRKTTGELVWSDLLKHNTHHIYLKHHVPKMGGQLWFVGSW